MYDVMQVVNWLRVRNNADMRENDYTEELTQMKAMKLLYYIQGVSLAYLDQRIFKQDIVAWKYGPAVEEVHNKYIHRRGIVGEISKEDLNDYKLLSSDKKASEVLNAVYDEFGGKSAIDLMKQTHSENPWKETAQSNIITDEKLKKFFKKVVKFK